MLALKFRNICVLSVAVGRVTVSQSVCDVVFVACASNLPTDTDLDGCSLFVLVCEGEFMANQRVWPSIRQQFYGIVRVFIVFLSLRCIFYRVRLTCLAVITAVASRCHSMGFLRWKSKERRPTCCKRVKTRIMQSSDLWAWASRP